MRRRSSFIVTDCTPGRTLPRRSFLWAASGAGLLAGGERSLFDGRTFRGWTGVGGQPFPSHCWAIEDGCLISRVVEPGFEDIRTEDSFGDFDFQFSWRIAAGGNCGVKYLIDRYDFWLPPGASTPNARARGFEYQLTDDTQSAEAQRDPTRGTASLYGRQPAVAAPLRAAGKWNESRIVVRRPDVEHWLNGRRVLKAAVGTGAPARSAISLQNHHSACWFRDLRIREL